MTSHESFRPFPPSPDQCIYFYPRQAPWVKLRNGQYGEQPFSIIVGPQVNTVSLGIGGDHIMIGFTFRPGGLQRLINMPMTELPQHAIDSSLLWQKEISELQEQMALTQDCTLMVFHAEQFLIKRFAQNLITSLPLDKVLELMAKPRAGHSIDVFAEMACLSPRQFDRKFYQRIGMTPKVFLRIVRFHAAVRKKTERPELDWLSVALDTGYYDFQHMLRDFKQFSEVSPSMLMTADAIVNNESLVLMK